MPSDADRDSRVEQPQQDAPAQTPTFSLGDIQTLVRESVREAVAAVVPQRQAPTMQPDPEPEDATDEDYNSNLPSAVKKAIRREMHGIKQEMNLFRNFGLDRLGNLTQEIVSKQLPYYAAYQKEIDGELSKLDPALRTDPTTIRLVHDTIAMRHEPERTAKMKEEIRNQMRGDAPAPGMNGRGAPKVEDGPQPSDLFDAAQVEEINRRGGPDAFAQRISGGRFKDWKSYAAASQTRTQSAGLRGNVIPFARLEPKKGIVNGG